MAQRAKSFRSFFLICGVVTGASVRAQVPADRPLRATESVGLSDDALDVYRAVLDTLYHNLGEQPPIILMFDSTQLRMDACVKWPCTIHTERATVDSQTIRAYEKLPQTALRFPHDFKARIPIRFISEPDSAGWMPFWETFRERFPGAWGVARLSRVGFDEQHREALVQVNNLCPYCGSIEIVLLKKVKGRWTIAERMLQSGSDYLDILKRYVSADGNSLDSATFGSLRYVGPNAHYLADFRRGRDSVARAKSDSIALAAAPRRIHGTVINDATGRPLQNVKVFVISMMSKTTHRFRTNSSGRFTARHFSLGGTMLLVKCATSDSLPMTEGYLGDTGLWAHGAIDTAVTVHVHNLNPCWEPRHLHKVQSGWFESPEARTATFPSADDSSVITALLEDITSKGSIVLLNKTGKQCVTSRPGCGGVQLARLENIGAVDSATIHDFLLRADSSTAIRPSLARARNSESITYDQVLYLINQVERTPDGTSLLPDLEYYQRNPDQLLNIPSFWRAFHRLYGKSTRLVSLSRIGFNDSRTQALVQVLSASKENDVPSLVLLNKRNTHWQIEKRAIEREGNAGDLETEARFSSDTSSSYMEVWRTVPRGQLVQRFRIREMNGEKFFGSWEPPDVDYFPIDSPRGGIANPGGYFCAEPLKETHESRTVR